MPLEFREISLKRGSVVLPAFTARRGEFYVDGVEVGNYQLELDGKSPCSATITVQDQGMSMTNVGVVICDSAAH